MDVLGLCDGISTGLLSLQRAGVRVANYYASEIDPAAIKISKKNFPEVIHIGDIKQVYGEDYPQVGLIMAGTPCQNLSQIVIDREEYSTGLEGEKSSLFYEFVRVLREVQAFNPDVLFLLENVGSMSDEDRDIITYALGVEPLVIDSNKVSAQNRLRYYWTNIPTQGDIGTCDLVLGDILQTPEEVDQTDHGRMKIWYEEDYEYHGDEYPVIATLDIKGHDMIRRVCNPKFKAPTLTTASGGNVQKKVLQDGRVRKLTPIEYERLQTLPDNFTEGVSHTRRYNLLGNGWTADVITWIVGHINNL